MVFYKFITICALCGIFMDFVENVPTFGDEFVHITLHVFNEPSSSRDILKSKSDLSQFSRTAHKVIHHFHRRRRPIKKVSRIETAPLLENILLAELDKPNNKHKANNNVLPPIDETYLEETLNKPAQSKYNHYEESQYHHHQPHLEYGKQNKETYNMFEDNEDQKHDYYHSYQPKQVKQHVETIKLSAEKPHYHYQQHISDEEHINDYDYHKPQEEIIKTLKTPKYKTSYGHHQEQEDQYEHSLHYDAEHHYDYHKPQKEIREIIKTNNPYERERDYDYNHNSKNLYDYYQLQEEIIKVKEPKYTAAKEKYNLYGKALETNYLYSRQPENFIEEHVEYRKPVEINHYSQQAQREQYHPDYKEKVETDYHYRTPSKSSQQSSFKTQYQQHYVPSPSFLPERKPLFNHSPSYAERPQYENSYIKGKNHAGDIQKHLPFTENPTEFYSSYKQPILSPELKQNTLYDELDATSGDWPSSAESAEAAETYSGYDGYSADDVQGLESYGYKFPFTYI